MAISIRIISNIFLFLSLPLWLLITMDINVAWLIIPLVCLEEFFIIVKYKELQVLQLMMLYLFVYFLYLIPYFFFGYQLSDYTKYQNPLYFIKTAYLFYLFYLGVLLVPYNRKDIVRKRLFDKIHYRTSKLHKLIYALMILAVLFLTMRQGQNVLNTDNAYEVYRENLESVNSLPLYLILLLVFFPIISKWNRNSKLFYAVLFLMITIFCITRGVRMVLAPAVILAYLVFLEGKLNSRRFIILVVLGYVFFIFVNALKMNMEMQMNTLFSEGSDNMIISHHADILYGAASCFGLISDGKLTIVERIPLTIAFVSEIIIPPQYISDIYKYPHIININSDTGGGGLFLPGALLMWGYVGVCLFGLFITKLLTSAYSARIVHPIRTVICIIVIVFFPRWMSYDYHVILKFPFLGLILYLFFLCKIKH